MAGGVTHDNFKSRMGAAIDPTSETRVGQLRSLLEFTKTQESQTSQYSLVDQLVTRFEALPDTGKDAVIAEAKRLSLWEASVAGGVTHDNFESRMGGSINPTSEVRAGQLQSLLEFTKKQEQGA